MSVRQVPQSRACPPFSAGRRRGGFRGDGDLPLVYVSPPEWAEIPLRTEKIFLKHYADSLPTTFDTNKIPVSSYYDNDVPAFFTFTGTKER